MVNIGVLIDDMFEDVEYISPVKAFEKNRHKIINIGLKEGKTVKGEENGTPVKIDKSVKNVSVNRFRCSSNSRGMFTGSFKRL